MGMIMFLGGILPSVVMNAVVGHQTDVLLIHHQRIFVSAISWALTIPGMWILVLSGVLAAIQGRFHPKQHRWLAVKMTLGMLIFLNGTFILAPLVGQVTQFAADGVVLGNLPTEYLSAKRTEDLMGLANFVMILVAFVLAILKPGAAKRQNA